jgi:hypothetical protein
MKWSKKQEKWARVNYVGQKKKIKMTVDRDADRGWYFYGGGYNSLAKGESYSTLEIAQTAAEMWIDMNWKTARID